MKSGEAAEDAACCTKAASHRSAPGDTHAPTYGMQLATLRQSECSNVDFHGLGSCFSPLLGNNQISFC